MLRVFVIGITFLTVFLAEIGDKSQLITISLASKYDGTKVFAGIFSGIAIITILGLMVGTLIFRYIPLIYVKMLASIIFISFGAYTLYFEEEMNIDITKRDGGIIWSSFLFATLAELGDKTQFAVIALTARYASPLSVLTGALIGMAAIIGISVALGCKLGEIVENRKMDLLVGSLFILLGIVFLVETLL